METASLTNTAVVVATESDKEAPLVRNILRKVGFRIVSGQGNLDRDVELAVVDADGVNPDAIMEELHGRYPEAKMLLLSEKGEDKLLEVAGFGHVRGALKKPFKRSQLVGSVLTLMERSKVLTA
jgi:hypothetical protein